ncbi:spore germination protein [Paenibacillus sp. FSL W8-0187]|uniref:spore germination protein n=1 Tax=Paenibacillus sp. FSL W8-0187 TaxID=2921710 RepID=UPI0030D85ADF
MKERSANYEQKEHITTHLKESLGRIEEAFTDTPDLIIRKLHIKQTGEEAALVYMDELTDKTCLNHDVLAPIQLESGNPSEDKELKPKALTVCRFNVFQLILVGRRCYQQLSSRFYHQSDLTSVPI